MTETTIQYLYADACGCRDPREGDGVHVAGEPSDLICLSSPMREEQADGRGETPDRSTSR